MTSPRKIRWPYVLVACCSALSISMALVTLWILRSTPKSVDFLSYWSAARLALGGRAAAAYDLIAHQAIERKVVALEGLLPFAYPPPFLLVLTPFGLPSFWLAFALWIAITASIYAAVVGRKGRALYALAHPSVMANFMIGQNGFLTTSILSGGLQMLSTRPFLAGAILGLMVIKPQLAIVLPFAMVGGRQWRAIAGAALSATGAGLLALIVFGWGAYQGFFSTLPLFASQMADGKWAWNELASVFAILRFFNVPPAPALAIQGIVGSAAIFLVSRAWWLGLEGRATMVAPAALLVPPYLFTYDALLLAMPMMWLLDRPRHVWVIPATWLLCALPIANYFGAYDGPNTLPLAAMLCLWALHSKHPQTDGLIANARTTGL